MQTNQFTLTVNEGKWLIAYAIAGMPEVRQAMAEGRVVFKAGTTVSCIAQAMLQVPLRICGRISERGAVSSKNPGKAAHCLLYEQGRIENLDSRVTEALLELGPGDVLITGANLIDAQGGAAMLAGSPGGGNCGRMLPAVAAEGVRIIIAAGLEKLSPVPVGAAVNAAGRKGVAVSRGMACGLLPLAGRVITELEAIRLLADVDVWLIGRGGINGAEGGCVFQICGKVEEVEKLENILLQCRNQPMGGDMISLEECAYPCSSCGQHLSCCHKTAGRREHREGKQGNF